MNNQLTGDNQKLSNRLPLLAIRPTVTLPDGQQHRPLAGTKLCDQGSNPWPVDCESNALTTPTPSHTGHCIPTWRHTAPLSRDQLPPAARVLPDSTLPSTAQCTHSYWHTDHRRISLMQVFMTYSDYMSKWTVSEYSYTAIHLAQHIIGQFGWLVEQGLTSHSTQFRSFRRRRFYRSDDPTNSVKALQEGG